MALVPESWGPNDEEAPAWALAFVEWYCTPPELREFATASAFAEYWGVPKSRCSELLRTAWFERHVKADKTFNGFSFADLAMVKDVVLKRALAGDVRAAQTVLAYAGEVTPEDTATAPGRLSDEQLAAELAERMTAGALPPASTTTTTTEE